MTKDLRWFAETHLGFGNPASPIWYIGPEPAGGSSDEAIALSLDDAVQQGVAIGNLRQHLINIQQTKYFDRTVPPTQAYWRRIAWLELIALHGIDKPTIDDARTFQVDSMLSVTGLECPLLLETSALPSKSTKVWPYEKWGLPPRQQYLATVLPARLQRIRKLILTHRPKIVVMFGSYYDRWNVLLNTPVDDVVYEILPHPGAHGLTDEDWTNFGLTLRTRLARPA